MPTAPLAVLAAAAGGSAPASPLLALAGASGGGAPAAPLVALAAASGGGAPTSPLVVLAAASGGGAPTSPLVVLAAASGGGAPTAPLAALAAAAGGSAPAAPLAALAAAAGGGAPAAPLSVLGAVENSGAYLETLFTGANNDLRFDEVGPSRSPLTTIQFVMDNSGSNSVNVTGNAVLVHLRQNFGAFYLTAADIKTLIEASSAAMALVRVSYRAGNNGSGQICQPSPNTNNISFGPSILTSEL